jgi:hypothetical protein
MLRMKQTALERLIEQSRALPGDKAAAGLPRAADRAAATGTVEPALAPAVLRRRVGALLSTLATQLDAVLPRALALAGTAWDQVDSLTVIDAPMGAELRLLRRAARTLAADEDGVRRASGLEAELTLDAAAGLVGLLERRLATLVRLKLRADDPALLDGDSRPFLDVAAALGEVARAWA